MLFTFGLPTSVQFQPNPCFIFRIQAKESASEEGEGGVMQVEKSMRVCARNYSDIEFIAQSRGRSWAPGLVPGTSGDWGCELPGSCGSTTSRPRLQSIRWPIYVRVRRVPRVLSPWFDSKFLSTTRDSFSSIPFTKSKNGESTSSQRNFGPIILDLW